MIRISEFLTGSVLVAVRFFCVVVVRFGGGNCQVLWWWISGFALGAVMAVIVRFLVVVVMFCGGGCQVLCWWLTSR